MGYIRHHAMVVTAFSSAALKPAHEKAVHFLGSLVTPMIDSRINGYCSFFVAPDGSKEGWEASNSGDAEREAFVRWLDAQRHEDHSSSYSWALLQYGDDEGDTRILIDSDHTERSALIED